MKSTLHNNKLLASNPLSLFLLIAIFMLVGCGSQDETTTDTSQQNDNLSFEIPESILGAKLDQAAGTLTATISVDGGTPQAMTVTDTTASINLKKIPTGSTSFTIVFTYDLAPFGPLVVASATKVIKVKDGANTLSFVSGDFDTASFDADGDGISNIIELDEFSTSSPVAALCKLGTAVLGSCELGS